MEFHIELIVVTQLLIKIETIYETDVLGEVPIWFGCWGKSRYGSFPGGKSRYGFVFGEFPIWFCRWGIPDMVSSLGNSRDVTSHHI